MSVETDEDLDSFFDTEDFADECVITGANDFSHTLNVILNTGTEPVEFAGVINIEAPNPSFVCKESDLSGVKKGMTATVRDKSYKIERLAFDQVDVATVYLSE
jgi:hypothetical protein